jgi:ComF family protein
MLNWMSHLAESILSMIYPPLCIHCDASVSKINHVFCQACAYSLELIDAKQRCQSCFWDPPASSSLLCEKCIVKDRLFHSIAAAFDYEGPAATLIKKLKQGGQPHLSKGAGAFLVAQWGALKWPVPDVIIPVPQKFSHWLHRGYNQSHLLANVIGQLLSRPVKPVLRCIDVGVSQTGLTKEQRMHLPQKKMRVRKVKFDLSDKIILLVDDVMTTGATLRACAQALLEECPSSLYGLAFCRSRL